MTTNGFTNDFTRWSEKRVLHIHRESVTRKNFSTFGRLGCTHRFESSVLHLTVLYMLTLFRYFAACYKNEYITIINLLFSLFFLILFFLQPR